MAAYISTYIYGNESFGGYFSVDGGSSVEVQDDVTYQIDPGPHHSEFFSTSNAQRNAGKLQAAIYRNTSSNGALFDELERREAMKNLGSHWTIDVFVEDEQMLVLNVRSNGNTIVGSPTYSVEDLTEEQSEALAEFFEELEQEIIAERNRPKRSKKKIVWGTILTFLGACMAASIVSGELEKTDPEWIPWFAVGLFLVIGLPLFIDGIRKKVRG